MPSFHPDDQAPPPETESRILTSYLLHPAPLPTLLPIKDFTSMFPRSQQSHPHIRTLYRDLQFQRNIDIENVRANIEREIDRGSSMRRKLLQDYLKEMHDADGSRLFVTGNNKKRKRKSQDTEEARLHIPDPEGDPNDITLDLDFSTHQTLSNLPTHASVSTNHTLPSLLAAMTRAVADLESETKNYETESARLWAQMQDTVGGLSDLRYGRFGARASDGQTIEEELEDGLRRLKEVCDSK